MDEHLIDRLQVVGPPGTSKVLHYELSRLCRRALDGFRVPRPQNAGSGAMVWPFDARAALVALRYQRTASRVLWDLYRSDATDLETLYQQLAPAVASDLRSWAWSGASFSIRPRNLQSFPAGVRQVVGTVKNALIDGCQKRGIDLVLSRERPDLNIAVRLHDQQITVSVDLAGESLHQRGYRLAAGEAPLRENLAAALLMLARYDARKDVLVDPMAGSGTIAIEGALMARGEPLGPERRACQSWPVFAELAVPNDALFADTKPRVVGNEIDGQVADGFVANAERAGVADYVEVVRGDFRDLDLPRLGPERSGLILTNPPYGQRLRDRDLDQLYRDFGRWCAKAGGYRKAVLVADPRFERFFGGRSRSKKPLSNASVRSTFYLFD
ncbi:MAG: hypothetical protein KJO07_14310 [Deltaproteobacteria bacterium]|nr:hypothetical protein [Deltaproteobacteria bacterium]